MVVLPMSHPHSLGQREPASSTLALWLGLTINMHLLTLSSMYVKYCHIFLWAYFALTGLEKSCFLTLK